MLELSPEQMKALERLFEAGFWPIAIPPYEKALCVHREECAAVLAPVPGDGLKLLAPPTYLIGGHLSVKLKKATGEVFVWKTTELAATAARMEKLEEFRRKLEEILGQASGAKQ